MSTGTPRVTIPVLAAFLCVFASLAGPPARAADASVEKPGPAGFGNTLPQVYSLLQADCPAAIIERDNQPIDMPTVKQKQSQIECVGLMFGGEPRRANFNFADMILDTVVIAIKPEERDSLRDMLVERYGEPSSVGGGETVFMVDGVLIRDEPPSVVFFSERMKEWFGKF